MAHSGIRGLAVFISDIRGCSNKDAERERVNKELAKIRTKFKSENSLSEYDRKKYVWKLLYIFMLGYEVDFGHMEALSLISCSKYPEKQVGYIATSVMLNESHEFLRLVINSIRNDVICRNESFQCLALTCVANVGGKEFAEALVGDVQKLLMTTTVRPVVRKKAALCLLRLLRKNPDAVHSDSWGCEQMLHLLEERDLGVLTAVLGLLTALVAADAQRYLPCVPKCVSALNRLVCNQEVPTEWTYYQIPSPWLQIKLMRCLQYFPVPEDNSVRSKLLSVLQRVLQGSEVVKNVNRNNATHAVLFEAISLVMYLDSEQELVVQCTALLGKFLSAREPNIRYLALENMARLAALPEMLAAVQNHQAKIVASIQDPDISIRRRALDLMFVMCDRSNVRDLMAELLLYLTTANVSMREELVLKMAVLAERYALDRLWYVDVMIEMIEKGGEFVSDDIWYRVVQVITNDDALQGYCADKMAELLRANATLDEPMVKISAYVVGEFGHLSKVAPTDLLDLLRPHLTAATPATTAILLSAFTKLSMHAPADDALRVSVRKILKKYEAFVEEEMQQRAVEYLVLTQRAAADPTMRDVLAEMPKFPERASALERSLAGKEEAESMAAAFQRGQVQGQGGIASKALAETTANSNGNGLAAASASAPSLTQPTEPPFAMLEDLLSVSPSGPAAPETANRAATGGAATSSSNNNSTSNQVANPMDLLSELIQDSTSAPAASQGAVDPFAAMDDLLVPAAAGGAPAAVQPIGDLQEWFDKLVAANSGVLYEDPHVQIGLKALYKGAQGRVVLYFGNKSDQVSVDKLQSNLVPTLGLHMQMVNSLAPTLAPKQQVQLVMDVMCKSPFLKPPAVHFSYTTNNGQVVAQQQVQLPITMNKFLQPKQVTDRNSFFEAWRTMGGPPLKQQEVIIVKPALVQVGLPGIAALFNCLSFNVVPDLDPNPNNLVTSASIASESPEELVCIVRLESDANNNSQFRLTVATANTVASSSLKELLLHQLKGANR
mmetsp:Transcript_28079/g.53476  ORF Transcript_28079/g.53476 Transcript_28079/m.53476 type:complete len:1010 (+) Transcript_28079:139-3168(+)